MSKINTIICHLEEKDRDEKEKSNIDGGEPFPCFKCPVDPIFKQLKSDILELTANIKLSIQIYIGSIIPDLISILASICVNFLE